MQQKNTTNLMDYPFIEIWMAPKPSQTPIPICLKSLGCPSEKNLKTPIWVQLKWDSVPRKAPRGPWELSIDISKAPSHAINWPNNAIK